MSTRRLLQRLTCFVAVAFFTGFTSDAVFAQGNGNGNAHGGGQGGPPIEEQAGGGGSDTEPPVIIIDPSGGTQNSPLTVTIYWCDNTTLTWSSREIKYNNVDVTSSFTWQEYFGEEGCIDNVSFRSVGTINLVSGKKITAKIRDNYINWTTKQAIYSVATQDTPTVSLPKHNGDNRDRSLCLTAGAGEAAAYQCGDLLITHSLPSYRTKGRDRSLTLLYNSGQDAPRAVVTADVSFPSSALPDTVEAILEVGGVERASAVYTGTWAGQTRQISIGFDASDSTNWPTGLYPFDLTVRAVYGSTPKERTVSDTLIIVSRSDSEFGRGWSLAGVEHLVFDQPGGTGNDILWVGGDGSARRYRKSGSAWIGAAGAFRDTITLSSGTYTRHLKHGVEVKYNSYGEHTKTINRVGDETVFNWTTLGTHRRLTGIDVPTAGATTRDTYTLTYYTGTFKRINYVTDPTGRVLNISNSGGVLTAITDPDSEVTSFSSSNGRVVQRENRRGVATDYEYGKDWRLTKVRVPLDTVAGDTATTTFTNWDESGLALGIGATPTGSPLPETVINGPRNTVGDIAYFRIDRWGAPTRIKDPLGNYTYITRGNSTHPALPTMVKYPNNRIVTLEWDQRANLVMQRDSTNHLSNGLPTAWQSWVYGDSSVPDSPTEVAVGPDSITTTFSYDSSLGLPDTLLAPNGHKTEFSYFESGGKIGLVQSIKEDSVDVFSPSANSTSTEDLVTSFGYDSYGNLVTDTFPDGSFREFERDSANRVNRTTNRAQEITEFEYDQLNRLTKRIQTIEGGTKLTTTTFWGVDQVDSIADPRAVTQRYVYDAGGRLKERRDEWDNPDRFSYDLAGNVTAIVPRHLTGRPDSTIVMTYDVMNRMVTKVWPDRDRPHANWKGLPYADWEEVIPGDSLTNSYDSATGWLTSAEVDDWSIERQYYATGALKYEKQRDHSAATSDTILQQRYGYDGMGRRLKHTIGTGSSADSVWYKYDSSTGELREIGVQWRTTVKDSVRFIWDALGRRRHLQFSAASGATNGALEVLYAYDRVGLLRRVCSTHHGSSDPTDVFRLRMEVEQADSLSRPLETLFGDQTDSECNTANQVGGPASTKNSFDKRGQLVIQVVGSDSVTYGYDKSGNQVQKRHWLSGTEIDRDTTFMFVSSNRVARFDRNLTGQNPFTTYMWYGHDGVRVEEEIWQNSIFNDRARFYWYDALGRISGNEYFDPCPDPTDPNVLLTCERRLPVACSYGPLGKQRTNCQGSAEIRHPFFYDGDNIVRTGADGESLAWTFVHGPGTDDPLLGMYEGGGGVGGPYYLYWVTDGQGRELAVAENDGQPITSPAQWALTSKYAGSIRQAQTFENSRLGGADTPSLSFYRNRVYDQRTGKWLQEDPLGVAAGTNLYQYVGNNPASYTDPFGLCPPELTGRPCLNPLTGREDSPQLRGDGKGYFGAPRRGGREHGGADLGTPLGSDVYSADRGKVVRTGEDAVSGKYIVLGHYNDDGTIVSHTYYGHLSGISVEEGHYIEAGQRIGKSGDTGNAQGEPEHLHFEVRKGRYSNSAVDPMQYYSVQ